jgi:hypothetical protein
VNPPGISLIAFVVIFGGAAALYGIGDQYLVGVVQLNR